MALSPVLPCDGIDGPFVCWQGVAYYFPDPPVGTAVTPVVTLNEDDTLTLDWGNAAGESMLARAARWVGRRFGY